MKEKRISIWWENDVTDHGLIAGFITEKGVVRRPEELRKAMESDGQ